MSEREEFEKWLLENQGLTAEWDDHRGLFNPLPAHLAWKAWQAARAQQARSGEAVGWIVPSIMKNDGWNFTADRKRAENWMVTSSEVQPVYTHPQPAQQGSVPEEVRDKVVWGVYDHLSHRFNFNRDPVLDMVGYLVDQGFIGSDVTPQPEGDGWVECADDLPKEYCLPIIGETISGEVLPVVMHHNVEGEYFAELSSGCGEEVKLIRWRYMPTGLNRPQPPVEQGGPE